MTYTTDITRDQLTPGLLDRLNSFTKYPSIPTPSECAKARDNRRNGFWDHDLNWSSAKLRLDAVPLVAMMPGKEMPLFLEDTWYVGTRP